MERENFENWFWGLIMCCILAIVLLTVALADMKNELAQLGKNTSEVTDKVTVLQSELTAKTNDNASKIKLLEDEVMFFINGGWK